jgi:FSR family fosmidomycin resistance protein-like MFS transporter
MGTFSKRIEDLMIISLGFLIYNIIAFGLQMFIGYFVDIHSIEHSKIAFVGCLLVCAGVLLGCFPWLALFLCALGNASFHIGGGINSLVYSEGKMARGGIFVSSGAIGVTLGTIAGRGEVPFWVIVILLLVCSYAIRFYCVFDKNKVIPNFDKLNVSKPIVTNGNLIICLCFISIMVRSYVGFQIPILWKTNTFLFILPSICAFIGKFGGGILADYFGARNVGVLSLLVSIPLLCSFNSNIVLCSIGLVMFNITMSITLWGIASQLKNQPGFAFGLTTLALLIGNIPIFLFTLPENLIEIVLPLLILVSSICILISIENPKRRGYINESINELSK